MPFHHRPDASCNTFRVRSAVGLSRPFAVRPSYGPFRGSESEAPPRLTVALPPQTPYVNLLLTPAPERFVTCDLDAAAARGANLPNQDPAGAIGRATHTPLHSTLQTELDYQK